MPPRLWEGRLHLPTQDKPPKDLLEPATEFGAQQGLGGELFLRIADQYPAYGYGRQTRAVPDCSGRSHLHGALPTTVPVIHSGGRPGGGRILGDDRKVWQAFTLQARSAYLPNSAWWGRTVERGIQAQASERHRLGQEAPAACKEPEASVSGIGHRNDLALGPPAPHQEECLRRPVGHLLVVLAPFGGVALGRSQDAQEWQCPYASGPGHQEHETHPPEAARFDEALVGGANRVAVDPFSSDLLAPAPFQRCVYIDHQWAAWHERSYQQIQQHTTHLSPRPNSTVEDTVVALELLSLPQAHDTQCGTNGP